MPITPSLVAPFLPCTKNNKLIHFIFSYFIVLLLFHKKKNLNSQLLYIKLVHLNPKKYNLTNQILNLLLSSSAINLRVTGSLHDC
jgi:hypothetical protein